ncbi:unnamed protein product [Alternaria sp. RS040]
MVIEATPIPIPARAPTLSPCGGFDAFDLEDGGPAVGEVEMALEDVRGVSVDDAVYVGVDVGVDEDVDKGVDEEAGSDDSTVGANCNDDVEVEDTGSPATATSANKFAVSLQQLASLQHQLSSPHFLTGVLSACHFLTSISPIIVRNNTTYYAFIADVSQTFHTLPCRIYTPLSPPQLHTFICSVKSFVILAYTIALANIVDNIRMASALMVSAITKRLALDIASAGLICNVCNGGTVTVIASARTGSHPTLWLAYDSCSTLENGKAGTGQSERNTVYRRILCVATYPMLSRGSILQVALLQERSHHA